MTDATLATDPNDGRELLRFRCTVCGACCQTLRATVTHVDVRRLMQATGEPARRIVAWLTPDEVDMTNEPGSFVELREGRRLMVLAHDAHGCRFLAGDRCSVHRTRPADCRQFPFDLEVDACGGLRRLRLLRYDGCDYAVDGSNDEPTLVRDDRDRWSLLREYQALVARHNRRMRTRRLLDKPLVGAHEFLEYLGLAGTSDR